MTYRFIGCGARTGSTFLSSGGGNLTDLMYQSVVMIVMLSQRMIAISRDGQHKLNDLRLFPGPVLPLYIPIVICAALRPSYDQALAGRGWSIDLSGLPVEYARRILKHVP